MSKERRYSMEEVTERLGVTARTLHYYEEIGLISGVGRSEGGHRWYMGETVQDLEHILQLKHVLGCSLQEIRSIMDAELELETLKASYAQETSQPARSAIREKAADLLRRQVVLIDEKVKGMLAMKTRFEERLHRVEKAEKKENQGAQTDS